MFLLLALLLLVFLPSPWNLAAALVSALLGAVEVVYWERRLRGRKVRTGVDELLGATGEVTSPLAPVGQIRVRGELWEAYSPEPIASGTRVRVVGIEDLRLEVRADGRRSGGTRAAGAGLLLMVVLALGACGGDDGSSASEDYANGVCSSLNTWVTDVGDTVKSLRDKGLSAKKDDIDMAVSDVSDSTDKLTADLEALGPPQSDAGNEAKSELDDLTTTLSQQIETVKQAVSSGNSAVQIAATVTTAVSTAANAVNASYERLRELDAAGELRDAFANSDDCKSLRDQLERDRS